MPAQMLLGKRNREISPNGSWCITENGLRPSTAVDKTVFQCTKFWIEKEAPMWVVELVSPEGTGIIWGVCVCVCVCVFFLNRKHF